jgi:tRNA G10  N-methylase Trm11
MKYLWIAGNHPALSYAELCSHVPGDILLPLSTDSILHETSLDQKQILELMKRCGGIIKVAEVFAEPEIVLNEDKSVNLDNIIDEIRSKIVGLNKKTDFGLSLYGLKTINPKEIGLTVKKLLKEEGIASRFVPVTVGYALSSASVLNNGLVEKGLEVCLAKQNNKILLARTIAIQELEEFSKFDYGRPDRDTKQGMLPPKLARMMVNLSGTQFDATIYDPFCGSG